MEQRENGDGESGSEGLAEIITPSEDYFALKRALLGLARNEKGTELEQQECCCSKDGQEGSFNKTSIEAEKLKLDHIQRDNLIEAHMRKNLIKAVELNKECISELILKGKQTLNDVISKQIQVPEDFCDETLQEKCVELTSNVSSGQYNQNEQQIALACETETNRVESKKIDGSCNNAECENKTECKDHDHTNEDLTNENVHKNNTEIEQLQHTRLLKNDLEVITEENCIEVDINARLENVCCDEVVCSRDCHQGHIEDQENTICNFQSQGDDTYKRLHPDSQQVDEQQKCTVTNEMSKVVNQNLKKLYEWFSQRDLQNRDQSRNNNQSVETSNQSQQSSQQHDFIEIKECFNENSINVKQKGTVSKLSLENIVLNQLKHIYELHSKDLNTSKNDHVDISSQTEPMKLEQENKEFEREDQKSSDDNANQKATCKSTHDSLETKNLNQSRSDYQTETALRSCLEDSALNALQDALEKAIYQYLHKLQSYSDSETQDTKKSDVSRDEQFYRVLREYIQLHLESKESDDCKGSTQCHLESKRDYIDTTDRNNVRLLDTTKNVDTNETFHQDVLEPNAITPKRGSNLLEQKLGDVPFKQNAPNSSVATESSGVEAPTSEQLEVDTILEAPEEFRLPDAEPSNDHSLEQSDHDIIKPSPTTEAVDTSHRPQSSALPPINVSDVGVTTTPTSSDITTTMEEGYSMALLSTLHGLKAAMAECTESSIDDGGGGVSSVGVVGVEINPRAPGCSRATDADRERTLVAELKTDGCCCCCSAKDNNSCEKCNSSGDSVETRSSPLRWTFKNGRLVFVDEEDEEGTDGESDGEKDGDEIIHSKELNKRITGNSRLKYLEQKLKKAGIQDDNTNEPKALNDSTTANNDENDDEDDENDLIPYDNDYSQFFTSCEFDVRQVASFSGFEADEYYVVYDEFDDDDDDACDENDETMRGDGIMGTEGERAQKQQHNPDHDNLRSLLKKPGKSRDGGKKNRVVFNENRNEFFDADYIILIREECDYDDDDDDVCCCNQHEMVRLTCCEPNCNCNSYNEGNYQEQMPQSPKFAPPLEFVDAVTLSPPEGYKDMELEEQLALQQMAKRGQRTAVCRECSASHEEQVEEIHSDNNEVNEEKIRQETQEKEKTDQSQQTTPTTPPVVDSENAKNYILETITMTAVTEQRTLKEAEEERKLSCSPSQLPGGSPISGILKGGKLWKQQGSLESNGTNKSSSETVQPLDSNITSDEEATARRSVRFIESSSKSKRDVCDGAPESVSEEHAAKQTEIHEKPVDGSFTLPESTEMMLTFKLGNHLLISNNSLKPNSAVRQLFPCTKALPTKVGDEDSAHHQYLVTAESLKAFEEAKRSKLPQIIQSGETDESIKRAIERNTLRRSLIRYEPKNKKNQQKTDNSLVERIKQLTCDVDDPETERASPPGEEARNSPEMSHAINKNIDKSFSPSSSSTASSNSSSVSSTYKKITDLFGKKERVDVNNIHNELIARPTPAPPDLGNGGIASHDVVDALHCPVTKVNSTSSESRKQFLSSLAPLTACVSAMGSVDEHYYHGGNAGERNSMASSVGTEYSLEDIDEGLKNDDDESKRITPDVLAGTPSASESGDELAIFVQQDASRIERIKKKYQPDANNELDDEHDDYGFNRRPSVRGIKPRFGSTTEILQQIQNQLQPLPPSATTANRTNNASQVSWPYYSEANIAGMDNTKQRNANIYQYEDAKKNFVPHYRPTSLIEESVYQNCAYRGNVNHMYAPVMKVGGGCGDYYHQTLPRNRNGRPQSPPPLDVSKTYHQTMVYIPYNHIEGYQPPNPYYAQNEVCYTRVSNQNQFNKRFIDPTYVGEEHHYSLPPPKHLIRVSYTNQMANRSESPLPGQFSTARSTQTPSTCNNYYPVRYRPVIGSWQGDAVYTGKVNRHSYPARFPSDDADSQQNLTLPNGYRQTIDSIPNSPTKPRFIERGVPEGAASVSPQDVSAQTGSTMTSPTSPQQQGKSLFYAMNV